LLICGLIIPFFYLRRGTEEGWHYSWYFLAACIAGITLLAGLLLRNPPENEKHDQHFPLRHAYRTPVVWHLAVIYAMFGISYIVYAAFFASYLVDEIGFTISSAGFLWSAVGIVSIVSGFVWGAVSDKAGRRSALVLVFVLQCSCYTVFGVWRAPPGAYISAAFFAVTSWSIPAVMAASVGDLFESRFAPVVFGFITLFFGIGQVVGPIIAGLIADTTGSYAYSFVAAGICAGLGAAGSLFLPRELKPIVSQ
jgi:predicted MFS family arabinose efflux permease